jgi:hypothetical protein
MVELMDHVADLDGSSPTLRKRGRLRKACDDVPITRFVGSYGSRDYWLARLVRDNRIELLAAVRCGSLSAYGAAVLAGYRKRTRRKKRSSLAAVEALIG